MKRDKYDKLMSNLIRERANWTCERCEMYYPEGHRGGLEHSHIWGRRRHSIRWEPDAGIALCTGCHREVGSNHDAHEALARSILGDERYAEMKLLANTTRKWKPWEKDELYVQMKLALKDMEERRSMGHTGRLEFYLEIA